jgi:chlorite dismutase
MTIERVSFVAGACGEWRIQSVTAITGAGLPVATHLKRQEGGEPEDGATWTLRGVRSHQRYTQRPEAATLMARQAGLDRHDASHGALLPIVKSEAWWHLAQDDRRAIFEETSHHIAIGTEYLPMIARRLYHGRDLGEPFDFLTWFEYAPAHSAAFAELLSRLRATEEWRYVVREIDIRVVRS